MEFMEWYLWADACHVKWTWIQTIFNRNLDRVAIHAVLSVRLARNVRANHRWIYTSFCSSSGPMVTCRIRPRLGPTGMLSWGSGVHHLFVVDFMVFLSGPGHPQICWWMNWKTEDGPFPTNSRLCHPIGRSFSPTKTAHVRFRLQVVFTHPHPHLILSIFRGRLTASDRCLTPTPPTIHAKRSGPSSSLFPRHTVASRINCTSAACRWMMGSWCPVSCMDAKACGVLDERVGYFCASWPSHGSLWICLGWETAWAMGPWVSQTHHVFRHQSISKNHGCWMGCWMCIAHILST